MATITETLLPEAYRASFPARVREFLWLSSGMFSAAALFLSFMGYFTVNGSAHAAEYFAAAVVSSVLFGIGTILKLGPETA